MAIEQLERAAIGRPINRAGVSLFPVYLPSGEGDGGIDIAAKADDVVISEQGSARVPTITVTNPGLRPVLLVEGETVTGGQQNRVINVSVLVPAGATVNVPVSCVEAGRWGGTSGFARGRTFAPRRVRRVKNASVAESIRQGGFKTSDQGAVWNTIDFELNRLNVDSSTRAIHATEALFDVDQTIAQAATDLVRRGPLPGQCGVVISHGRRIVSAEIFATPELLSANWEALVRATLLDLPAAPEGRPSAGRALWFLHQLATTKTTDSPGVGLGREQHVRTRHFIGQALTLDGAVVHASAFAIAA